MAHSAMQDEVRVAIGGDREREPVDGTVGGPETLQTSTENEWKLVGPTCPRLPVKRAT